MYPHSPKTIAKRCEKPAREIDSLSRGSSLFPDNDRDLLAILAQS